MLCKNDKLIIPASLQHGAVSWYHHYLQHPGHSHLKETMRSMMYWKGMCNSIQKYIKSCRSCQINKRQSQKYGHVPSKLVIISPWKALCVDLIGLYTLTGKDGSSIDFMCLTMINPATSWFEIVELPSVDKATFPTLNKGKKATCNNYTKDSVTTFDKSSAQISKLCFLPFFHKKMKMEAETDVFLPLRCKDVTAKLFNSFFPPTPECVIFLLSIGLR